VQLRDGREARVLAVFPDQEWPLAIAWLEEDGQWGVDTRSANGRASSHPEHPVDLIHKPKVVTFERWVNVYPDHLMHHTSQERADAFAERNRLGPAEKITITRELPGDQEGSL